MLSFNRFCGQFLSFCVLINLVACSDSYVDEKTEKVHPVAYDLEPLAGGEGKSDGLTDRFDQEWCCLHLRCPTESKLIP